MNSRISPIHKHAIYCLIVEYVNISMLNITADSEHNARAKLAREFVLVLAGRINLQSDCTLSANTFPSISFAEVDHA